MTRETPKKFAGPPYFLALSLLAIAGCASAGPGLLAPGTLQQKRIQATVHDPYTDNEAGPEVVGGRPRDYQQPLAEPVRNRLFVDSWWGQ